MKTATETGMELLTRQDDFAAILEDRQPPCLSLYQPTHRHRPEDQQDPIRYKNLLKKLENSLLQQYPVRDARALLDPFRTFARDEDFWNHTWDGLAVLGAAGMFRVFKLQRPVPELAVVATSFHVKPLLRIVQSGERYQILSLNRREIRLFQGNRDHLDEVELAAGVPRTITDALGGDLTEPHLNISMSYGAGPGMAVWQGQGSKKDELKIDEERFFRAIDRAVLERYSRPSGLPLLLAALTEYQTPFRQISQNPFLMPNGIEMDTNSLTIDQLRQRAWSVVQPEFRARLAKLAGEFEESRSKGMGTDDVAKAAQAAVEARIGSLLVEAERQIPGRLNRETGQVTFSSLEHPETDDLLDDIAELVLKKGGHTVVVPAADMPTATGVAATFRF